MECVIDAHGRYIECLDSLSCNGLTDCGRQLDTALRVCGPEEAQVRETCFLIDCPSGEAVPAAAQCDGVQDCADGFDEANCFAGGGS